MLAEKMLDKQNKKKNLNKFRHELSIKDSDNRMKDERWRNNTVETTYRSYNRPLMKKKILLF